MFAEILPPTQCPSCDSVLVWVNDQLFCRSKNCPAQNSKAVEHFAKTMKIKGLGPAAISKLGLVSPSDIYALTEDDICDALGSEKVGLKLYAEIENSVSAPLELLLPAFGIPLIGNTATRKLSETVKTIHEIDADTCQRAGLGPKATENLMQWLDWDASYFFEEMPGFSWEFSGSSAVAASKGVVCISGRLKSFKTKADATTALNAAGYEVKSSLTKQVNYLINEGGQESAKTRQARDSGVTIVTNLSEFLGEH
jgi:DNA ligase (NAD+)